MAHGVLLPLSNAIGDETLEFVLATVDEFLAPDEGSPEGLDGLGIQALAQPGREASLLGPERHNHDDP